MAYTKEQLDLAAAEMKKHDEMELGTSLSGRMMYTCECGELLGESANDEGEGFTDREFDEAMREGHYHRAEAALRAALGAN